MAVGYVVFRILGRVIGSYFGAKWAKCEQKQYAWMGFAMLPHAGVPIGMALLAIQQFPHLKEPILAVILSATVAFELVGPIATRWLLVKSGESARQTELDFDSKS